MVHRIEEVTKDLTPDETAAPEEVPADSLPVFDDEED